MKRRGYTRKQIDYVEKIAEGKLTKEITENFNSKFNDNRSVRAIGALMFRNNIKSNALHRPSSFNKGENGNNIRVIGSEHIRDGQLWVKIKQPNVWQSKHRYLWEKEYGDIKEGYDIIFKDGDKNNFNLDNLFSTPQGVASATTRRGMNQVNGELNVTAHRLSELIINIKRKETNH